MKKFLYFCSFLFFLVLIPVTVFFVYKGFETKEGDRTESLRPVDIKVVKDGPNDYTVSWKTLTPSYGYLIWGYSPKLLDNSSIDENSEVKIYIHRYSVKATQIPFYYKIYSGDESYGDEVTLMPYIYNGK